jgi:hypothetical protein
MDRRSFLKQTGIVVGLAAVPTVKAATTGIAIVVDPQDRIASAAAPSWAVRELQSAFSAQGITAKLYPSLGAAPASDTHIVVAGVAQPTARQILSATNTSVPNGAEGLVLAQGHVSGRSALLAGGTDELGLVYAALELADRVQHGTPLTVNAPIVEKRANVVRSCARCFVSDVEDKSWFYDRAMWTDYLTMLAANRFNRFNLTLGIGYNFPREVSDSYFYFPYPFLLEVPGYNVKAVGLPDAERDRNLQMLKFIGEQTALRGLQFNLGLWSHAYEYNPNTNYKISGLTPETHAAYCRDALGLVLKECPSITGLSFRQHMESGIPDGRFDFWETLFEGIKNAGRTINIDLHAKGTTPKHIAIARATGMPVSMAPKFWAEHMGMAYHQAAIREMEFEPRKGSLTFQRNFLRYGYGDYLKETRDYGIIHRIWPGTQRHLMWGDPTLAAGYGQAFSFAGSLGFEWFEPLSFKGRMGSGIAGGRIALADKSLEPKFDWQKYEYTYRVWGRLTYNPESDPDGHRRYLRQHFQAAAQPLETSLGHASRILPVITTAHGPSGANNSYWPEMYMNMPIVDAAIAHPYNDTPQPKVFGNVSPFDPQLFSTSNECAAVLLKGEPSVKYTPLDVAQWLEDCATTATQNQTTAAAKAPNKNAPEFRRMAADIQIMSGTGKFFAYRFRSAVLWALYQSSGDKTALTEALKAYRTARDAWVAMSPTAKAVYIADITYGKNANARGNWADRITGIDADLAAMEKETQNPTVTPATAADPAAVRQAIAAVLSPPKRLKVNANHKPVERFDPGKPIEVSIAFASGNADRKVMLLYRQTDQSQRWRSAEMQARGNTFRGEVPGDYTQSPYPIQYYFEVHEPGGATIFPGFAAELSNQPYLLARSSQARQQDEQISKGSVASAQKSTE